MIVERCFEYKLLFALRMNISKLILCTQDLRKQSAELMRCVDSTRCACSKRMYSAVLNYHITFHVDADNKSYTTHTKVSSCGTTKPGENNLVITEIASHARRLNYCEVQQPDAHCPIEELRGKAALNTQAHQNILTNLDELMNSTRPLL